MILVPSLPPGAEILSNLLDDAIDFREPNVMLVRLRNGVHIDVGWWVYGGCYLVTAYRDDWDDWIEHRFVGTPQLVIAAVEEMAARLTG